MQTEDFQLGEFVLPAPDLQADLDKLRKEYEALGYELADTKDLLEDRDKEIAALKADVQKGHDINLGLQDQMIKAQNETKAQYELTL